MTDVLSFTTNGEVSAEIPRKKDRDILRQQPEGFC